MNETSQTTSSGGNGSSSQLAGVHALEHGHARVGAELRVELAVADVERDDARRAPLEQAVGEATGRGAEVEAVEARHVETHGVESVGELLAAARDEARRRLDRQLGVLVDLRARLGVAGHEPGEDERLSLRAALGEPALDEQDVQALLHERACIRPAATQIAAAATRSTAQATVGRGSSTLGICQLAQPRFQTCSIQRSLAMLPRP